MCSRGYKRRTKKGLSGVIPLSPVNKLHKARDFPVMLDWVDDVRNQCSIVPTES